MATTTCKHAILRLLLYGSEVNHYLPGSTSARRLSRVRDALSSWLNILSIITISAEGFIRCREGDKSVVSHTSVPNQNIYSSVTSSEKKKCSIIKEMSRKFTIPQHPQQPWLWPQPLLKLNRKWLFPFHGTPYLLKDCKTGNYCSSFKNCTFSGPSMLTTEHHSFLHHTASFSFREKTRENLAMGPVYHSVSSLHFFFHPFN